MSGVSKAFPLLIWSLGCTLCVHSLINPVLAAPRSSAPDSLSSPFPKAVPPSQGRDLEKLFQQAISDPGTIKLPEQKVSVDQLMKMTMEITADGPLAPYPNWLKSDRFKSRVNECSPEQHLGPNPPMTPWEINLVGRYSEELAQKVINCIAACERKRAATEDRLNSRMSCRSELSEEEMLDRLKFWREMLQAEHQYWQQCFNSAGDGHILIREPKPGDHVEKFWGSLNALLNCQEIMGEKFTRYLWKSGLMPEIRELYGEVYAKLYPEESKNPVYILPNPIVQPIQVGGSKPNEEMPPLWWLFCVPEPAKGGGAVGGTVGGAAQTGLKCVIRKAGGVFFSLVPMELLPGYVPPKDDPYNPPNAL